VFDVLIFTSFFFNKYLLKDTVICSCNRFCRVIFHLSETFVWIKKSNFPYLFFFFFFFFFFFLSISCPVPESRIIKILHAQTKVKHTICYYMKFLRVSKIISLLCDQIILKLIKNREYMIALFWQYGCIFIFGTPHHFKLKLHEE
jgi:hypothetical protein